MDPATVFVYGTLMPGERNAAVAAQAGGPAARPACLHGHRLYHLSPEAYPALVPGTPEDTVRGYALTYAPDIWVTALSLLDALEGTRETPPLYTRSRVTLTLEGGAPAPAWVYVYARPGRLNQSGAEYVPGGDWRTVSTR